MRNSIDQGGLTAVITGGTVYPKPTATSQPQQIVFNTQDPHNFKTGQIITVTGISAPTTANIVNGIVANVANSNSFIAYVTDGTAVTTGTITLGTAPTAWVSNKWASLIKIKTAQPPATTAALSTAGWNSAYISFGDFTYSKNSKGYLIPSVNYGVSNSVSPAATLSITRYVNGQSEGVVYSTIYTASMGAQYVETLNTNYTGKSLYYKITVANTYSAVSATTSTVTLS